MLLPAIRSRLLLAASLLDVEKRGVSPGQELVECLVRCERGQAYADPSANVVLDRSIDRIETTLDFIKVDSAESTHELVATIANDRVVGAQIRSHGLDECLQHTIAGGVSIPIVGALQSVDVSKGEDEASVAPPCAVDLMGEREPATLAAIGSGEVVQVSVMQLGLQAGAFLGGIGSILRGPVSISGCTGPGRSGAGPELLELLCQRRIRAGNGAVELLGANIPDSRRLIACGRLGVAPVGRVDS
jgi:hypothetical protein